MDNTSSRCSLPSESIKEDAKLQIRQELSQNSIKLWLPPYYDPTQCQEITEQLSTLASDLSSKLHLDSRVCLDTLIELRSNSVRRLGEKEKYANEGLATIHARVSSKPVREISHVTKLTALVSEMKRDLSRILNVPAERLKCVSAGKLLSNELSLESQGVKHGSSMLIIALDADPTESKFETEYQTLQKTKANLRHLADRETDSKQHFMEIADQNGKILDIPAEERKPLLLAMSLHETGRAALKRERYSLALIYLLEADCEFGKCQADILNSVDNYGLLNLDIAWCYLQMESLNDLPEAENRLKVCEKKFNDSYGPNLERLISLRGTAGWEAVLLMRLHLLQGVASYYSNKRAQAKKLLQRARLESESLKVNDEQLGTLLEMGYSVRESRLALRATYNDLPEAVAFIARKRQNEETNKKERERRILARTYGPCANGQSIDLPSLDAMRAMGYCEIFAAEALKTKNNDMGAAIEWVQSLRETMDASLDAATSNRLMEMSYEDWCALMDKCGSNIREAIVSITSADQRLQTTSGYELLSGNVNELSDRSLGSTSDDPLASTSDTELDQAAKDLASNISDDPDDYVDCNLEKESEILEKYEALLRNE